MRWHKDQYRNSVNGFDNSRLPSETPRLTPDASYTPFGHNKIRASAPGLRCFASATNEHVDAERLRQLGVWLGDTHDETRSVNGPSQQEVQKSYFEITMGGKDCGNAEPHVFWDRPSSCKQQVACAANHGPMCHFLRPLECIAFEHTNEDDLDLDVENREHMMKFVS